MPGNLLDDGIVLAKWRHAFNLLRSSPRSSFGELREAVERMHSGTDIRIPDPHATRAPAPTARRGRPPCDWPRITQIVAEFRRTFFAQNNRAPSWKQCRQALWDVLGSKTPHVETLKRKLRSR